MNEIPYEQTHLSEHGRDSCFYFLADLPRKVLCRYSAVWQRSGCCSFPTRRPPQICCSDFPFANSHRLDATLTGCTWRAAPRHRVFTCSSERLWTGGTSWDLKRRLVKPDDDSNPSRLYPQTTTSKHLLSAFICGQLNLQSSVWKSLTSRTWGKKKSASVVVLLRRNRTILPRKANMVLGTTAWRRVFGCSIPIISKILWNSVNGSNIWSQSPSFLIAAKQSYVNETSVNFA